MDIFLKKIAVGGKEIKGRSMFSGIYNKIIILYMLILIIVTIILILIILILNINIIYDY